jgi:hypothetical protein
MQAQDHTFGDDEPCGDGIDVTGQPVMKSEARWRGMANGRRDAPGVTFPEFMANGSLARREPVSGRRGQDSERFTFSLRTAPYKRFISGSPSGRQPWKIPSLPAYCGEKIQRVVVLSVG